MRCSKQNRSSRREEALIQPRINANVHESKRGEADRFIEGVGGKLVCEVNPFTVRERRGGSREDAEGTEREEPTREPCEGCFHVAKVVDSDARNSTRAVGREPPASASDGLEFCVDAEN